MLRTLTKLSEPDHKRRNQLASAAALFFGLSQAIVPAAMAVFFAWGGSRYADGSDSLSTVSPDASPAPAAPLWDSY